MSGMFTLVSTILQSAIGDPSQNGWWGGAPRGQITFPNGPGAAPELGAVLTLEQLARANELVEYHKARVYWLGNEYLAKKYGMSPPTLLTPVEDEMWKRQIGILQFAVSRITELMEIPLGLRSQQGAAPPEKQGAAPPEKQGAAPESLAERFRTASVEERTEFLKALFGSATPT